MCEENELEIFLSEASDKVRQNIASYWNAKLGLLLTMDDVTTIFGDELHTWADFESYNFCNGASYKSIDTADREILNSWLWMRLFGEDVPDFPSEDDVNLLIEKFQNPDWKRHLYSTPEVRKWISVRHSAIKNARFDIKPFDVEGLTLPEHLVIEGVGPIVDAVTAVLEEHRDELNSKLSEILARAKG